MHCGDGDNMTDKRTTRVCDYHGEKNPRAKLTKVEVRTIRQLYKVGNAPTMIARFFPVSRSNISNIVARRTWKHI